MAISRASGPTETIHRCDALSVVHERLLAWFAAEKRDLPWRRTTDPYHILVSEVMLQQTQAARVAPKFEAFIQQFPTLEALAAAPVAEVIRAWQGLGYNRRAVRLHAMAGEMLRRWGRVPEGTEELRSLDGIGRYTAAAVASFAYGVQAAAVDTNIRRVLLRVFLGDAEAPRGQRWLEDLAERVLPDGRAAEWNGAVMELGARICVAGRPRCEECPLADVCPTRSAGAPDGGLRRVAEVRADYRAAPRYHESARYYRGRIIDALRDPVHGEGLDLEALGRRVREDFGVEHLDRLEELVCALERDGLVKVARHEDGAVRAVSLP